MANSSEGMCHFFCQLPARIYSLTVVVKASVSSVFCSSSWALAEPVAGLALARVSRNAGACLGPCRLFEARKHVEERAHVARFFLHPDDFAGVRMGVEGRGDFFARQRVKLIEKKNGGSGIFAAAAFGAQFVADFAAGDQDALGVVYIAIGNQLLRIAVR